MQQEEWHVSIPNFALEARGREGWELVAVITRVASSQADRYIFKRPPAKDLF